MLTVIRRKVDGTFGKGTKSGKQFKKGNVPWNKGLKGIHLSPDTEFKKNTHVGAEHPSWKGGINICMHDCVYLRTGVNIRVRRNRKVYEEIYGEIPEGFVIFHKNGDPHDDDPANLEAISRGELIKRNREKNRGSGAS